MAEIPGGKINLRDDRTKTKWEADIAPFLMSKFQVTQAVYFGLTRENPSFFKGDNRPVETVTWKEAIVFCNLLSAEAGLEPCYTLSETNDDISYDHHKKGFRLPTEAEWEFACKAGTTGIRYGELDTIAWYKNNAGNTTHDVGEKNPNAWGLCDMLGNVWEWCSDIYDAEVYGSYRVLRGGGFCDEERSVMATNRRRSHPLKFKIEDLGFRVARSR